MQKINFKTKATVELSTVKVLKNCKSLASLPISFRFDDTPRI